MEDYTQFSAYKGLVKELNDAREEGEFEELKSKQDLDDTETARLEKLYFIERYVKAKKRYPLTIDEFIKSIEVSIEILKKPNAAIVNSRGCISQTDCLLIFHGKAQN